MIVEIAGKGRKKIVILIRSAKWPVNVDGNAKLTRTFYSQANSVKE